MNPKRRSLHLAQPAATSWMRSLKPRFSICSHNSLRHWVFLVHHMRLLLRRPHASQRELRSSQAVPNVQPSTAANNMSSGGKCNWNWCHKIENASLFALQFFYLGQRGILTRKLKIFTMHRLKYCGKHVCNTIKIATRSLKQFSSSSNRPSDIAVTVNINAVVNLSLIWW